MAPAPGTSASEACGHLALPLVEDHPEGGSMGPGKLQTHVRQGMAGGGSKTCTAHRSWPGPVGFGESVPPTPSSHSLSLPSLPCVPSLGVLCCSIRRCRGSRLEVGSWSGLSGATGSSYAVRPSLHPRSCWVPPSRVTRFTLRKAGVVASAPSNSSGSACSSGDLILFLDGPHLPRKAEALTW